MDHQRKVVKEREADLASLLSTSRAPAVSSPKPSLTITDVEGIITDQERGLLDHLKAMEDRLDQKITRVRGKSIAPTFPSYNVADETATPTSSAEIESSQAQTKYGKPMNSYTGQPQLPHRCWGNPLSTPESLVDTPDSPVQHQTFRHRAPDSPVCTPHPAEHWTFRRITPGCPMPPACPAERRTIL